MTKKIILSLVFLFSVTPCGTSQGAETGKTDKKLQERKISSLETTRTHTPKGKQADAREKSGKSLFGMNTKVMVVIKAGLVLLLLFLSYIFIFKNEKPVTQQQELHDHPAINSSQAIADLNETDDDELNDNENETDSEEVETDDGGLNETDNETDDEFDFDEDKKKRIFEALRDSLCPRFLKREVVWEGAISRDRLWWHDYLLTAPILFSLMEKDEIKSGEQYKTIKKYHKSHIELPVLVKYLREYIEENTDYHAEVSNDKEETDEFGSKFIIEGEYRSAFFDRESKYIVTTSRNGKVELWNAENGESMMDPIQSTRIIPLIASLVPNGEDLVVGGDKQNLIVFKKNEENKKSWVSKGRLKGNQASVQAVSFSSDGELMVTGGREGEVIVWEWKQDEQKNDDEQEDDNGQKNDNEQKGEWMLKYTLEGHTEHYIDQVSFSPDNKLIVSVSYWGQEIKVWDVESGKPVHDFKDHTTMTRSACFHPLHKGEDALIVSSSAGDVKIWKAKTGEVIQTLEAYVQDISFSPDGKRLVDGSSSRGGGITFWEWDEKEKQYRSCSKLQSDGKIERVSYDPSGKLILSLEGNGVKVWKACEHQPLVLKAKKERREGPLLPFLYREPYIDEHIYEKNGYLAWAFKARWGQKESKKPFRDLLDNHGLMANGFLAKGACILESRNGEDYLCLTTTQRYILIMFMMFEYCSDDISPLEIVDVIERYMTPIPSSLRLVRPDDATFNELRSL